MSTTDRQKELLDIINDNTYVTVNELAERTFTSPSSIRRDLTALQNLGLVKRSHGGVSAPEKAGQVAGFYNRSAKNVKEKRLIAKKASSLLCDCQSIFLDSSTTSSFLVPYIARLDSAIIFTNNLEIALSAVRQGITTHCIGGRVLDNSVTLTGAEALRTISELNVDIMFFSSQSLSQDGMISDSTEAESYIRAQMLKKAKTTVFLCDSEKFNSSSLYSLTSLDNIDFAVFDKPYEELITKATIL